MPFRSLIALVAFLLASTGAASAAGTYRAEVLSDRPLVYFPLDETRGNVAHDLSGHHHDGAIGRRVARNQPAVIGDARASLAFSGADKSGGANDVRVRGGRAFALAKNVTIEAWVIPDDVGIHGNNSGDITLAAYGRDDNPDKQHCRFALELDAHSHVFHFPAVIAGKKLDTPVTGVRSFFQALHDRLWDTVSARELYARDGSDGFPPVAHRRYYLVGTYDGDTMRFYINGRLNNTMHIVGHITGYTSRDGMGIGGEYVDVNPLFHGRINEVAVYDHALSPGRIAQHYAAGIAFDVAKRDAATPPGSSRRRVPGRSPGPSKGGA